VAPGVEAELAGIDETGLDDTGGETSFDDAGGDEAVAAVDGDQE